MQTGSGKQPQLTEFQQLCIGFVRAAKGESLLDGIAGSREPSASNETTTSSNPDLGDSVEEFDRSTSQVPKKKIVEEVWKKKFFAKLESLEESRHAAEMKKTNLQCYNLVLRNMCLEKQLGISINQNLYLQILPKHLIS